MAAAAGLKKTEFIWMDGQLVPWEAAQVHLLTHSLHYGLGAFEGIRAYQTADGRTAIFRLHDHIRRLYESAHICLMEMPRPLAEVEQACVDLLKKNQMAHGYLRPLAWHGDGLMGLGSITPVRVAVAAWEWGSYLGDDGIKNGIRAKVSSFTRMHVNVNLVRGKITGQYTNSVLAKREALLGGYQEAILLDAQGFVAEATGENIFMVKDNIVFTPPLSSPILAGITRSSVGHILKDLGLDVRQTTFTRDSLYIADEVFLCGTAAEITPVREVDNRRVGTGKPGPITQQVQEIYGRTVRGAEKKYEGWLTYL
jgi:branched-chain amino acid aminotransferase